MLLALSSTAFAIPAQRLWRTHKQSDGKEITYMLCGDEHCHYYMSADSFLLKRNPSNGDFEYLQRNQQRVRPAEMRNAKPIQQPIQSRTRKTAYMERKKDSSSSLNSTTSSFPGLTSKLYTTASVT
ncbi:MAG: hypothetical protein SOZ60_02140 [Prevotella sp.]|nr:hypothetical protein [Prevotella sp.]